MKNPLWVFVMVALLVSGCSDKKEKPAEVRTFETKEEAIQQYINEPNQVSSIVQLKLPEEQEVLLVEESSDTFYFAKVTAHEQGYYVAKLDAGVRIDNTIGASWQYKMTSDQEYTISIMKPEAAQGGAYVKELDLYVTVAEGAVAFDQMSVAPNVLQSASVLEQNRN